jgi:hypothetical protein
MTGCEVLLIKDIESGKDFDIHLREIQAIFGALWIRIYQSHDQL